MIMFDLEMQIYFIFWCFAELEITDLDPRYVIIL